MKEAVKKVFVDYQRLKSFFLYFTTHTLTHNKILVRAYRARESERMKTYQNAGKILPEELFNEVKKYHIGSLYIPHENDRDGRKKLVIAHWKQNTPAKEIALITGLSLRRVHQIIAEERHNNAFLGCQKVERRFDDCNQQEREEGTAVPY